MNKAKHNSHNLKLDPRNARKHGERNKALIRQSLEAVGGFRSIAVDGQNIIRAGNGVFAEAQALGLKVRVVDAKRNELIAVRRSDLKGKEAIRAAALDNLAADSSAFDYDAEILAEIARDDELVAQIAREEKAIAALLRAEAKPEKVDAGELLDKAAEVQKKWQVKRGDVWQIGKHRLMCGDSTNPDDINKLTDGKKADCVFTSPPYAVGVEYGEYQDTIENLREMLPKLSRLWLDGVVDGGFAVINFGDIVSARGISETKEPCEYPMALEYWPIFRADGWILWSRRIWCKPAAGTGSMQCISSNRAATNWEHVWTWKKPGVSLFKSQTTGEYPSQNGWIDSTHTHKLGVGLETHGAGMPVFVPLYFVSTHSLAGGIVHEPFTGTGTTLVACEQTGRIGYGMEIEPKYCAVTLERLTNLGLTAKRVTNGNGKGAARVGRAKDT